MVFGIFLFDMVDIRATDENYIMILLYIIYII